MSTAWMICVYVLQLQQIPSRAPPSEEWDGAAAYEAAQWDKEFPRDYYEKPPLQGFYYTPQPGLIQHYA